MRMMTLTPMNSQYWSVMKYTSAYNSITIDWQKSEISKNRLRPHIYIIEPKT
jgi:hypothetical protein